MPLVVYKSSAGSGKTTTLVNEYLKITLKNPQVFSSVLAITFTNKAANEMKERILEALLKLSTGEGSKLSEFSSLMSFVGLSESEVSKRAGVLLSLILHRYDEFAVSTIDSFVHRIVRTFATDVKLPQNFEVVIDNDEIVPEIIEKLYEKVVPGNVFTGLMVDFVMKQVEDEKSYDPTRMLDEFIKKQLNEDSHYHLKKIEHLDTDDFLLITKKVNSLFKQKKSALQKIADEAMSLIHENGLLCEAFSQGKNGIYGYFQKIQNFKDDSKIGPGLNTSKTIEEGKWYSSKANSSDKKMIDAITTDLIEKYNETLRQATEYWFFKFISDKIHQLALMKEIRWLFSEYTEKTQRVHISEFNKKISDQIAGQPVPFIYERLGRKYQHFLIDEFQDTSQLQWQNLLPLLEESLAVNNMNMLVGDTKQAIYRFRNGEVELFASLPKIYKNDGSPELVNRQKLLEFSYQEVPLDVNYRSKEEIIHFNNDFFDSLKSGLSERLQRIYGGHRQNLPLGLDRKGGFVSVELIPSETAADYFEKRLLHIQQCVDRLMSAGYSRKDICVLSSTNENSAEVASFLVVNGHKVISPESLLLTNSPAVRLLVSFLKLISDSKQILFQADFLYNLLLVRNEETKFHDFYSEIIKGSNFDLDLWLHSLQVDIRINDLSGLSIYESAELLIRKLELNARQDAFVLNFLDFVYENQDSVSGRLDQFLEKWEKKKDKASVITPTEEDAISVMTIHKAKGLKFNNVLVDIKQTNNRKGKSEFWTELHIEEISELKIGLMPIKKDLEKAGFGHIYEEENDKTLLDFINMVYVAFTRTVNSMFILSQLPEKNRNKLTEFLIGFLQTKGNYTEDRTNYEFGELEAPKNGKEKPQKEKLSWDEFLSTDWKELVSIAHSDEILWDLIDQKPARSFGNLLHMMLSDIYTSEDIPRITQSYLHSGIIDLKESAEIQSMLYQVVNHPRLKSYFGNDILCKNETEIITSDGKTIRPDKVVVSGNALCIIDYKTGEKSNLHNLQIQQYANTFAALGFTNVSKILVYVNDTVELVEV